METIRNDPGKAGQLAGERELLGEFGRYAVAPVHTRFDAVSWFVWDAEKPDDNLRPSVVRQEASKEAALRGLEILGRGDERKLAQLGARVVEILDPEWPVDGFDKIGDVREAARSLGLLGGQERPSIGDEHESEYEQEAKPPEEAQP